MEKTPATLQQDTNSNKRLLQTATYASVAVATVLMLLKLIAWMVTDAISLLSTLVDSILDFAASTLNLFAVRQALLPATRLYRFGHGKSEALAALSQGAFISGSAVFLFIEGGHRLLHPQPLQETSAGIGIMVISIIITIFLVRFQRRVVAKTNSVAISADSLHYYSDLLINGGVIISLLVVSFLGWEVVDPLFGIVIAFYILYIAWEIGKKALFILMDRELPDEDRERVCSIALSHPKVEGLHELRTRSSGPQSFIQLHLEMDGKISLLQAHEIAEEVESMIQKEFPEAEIIIHQDPAGQHEKRRPF